VISWQDKVSKMRRTGLLFVMMMMGASRVSAQATRSADPLQCWWRTSAGAIRVGEQFTIVLTCAVLETDAATVVVDQSRLEPSVVQFAPFEVLGGSHGADLRRDDRRFFQYEYRARLIAENQFGKDVSLPETKLSYHIQSSVGEKTALQGRDQSYILPPLSLRVLSLVPADATDIRDTPSVTFQDIDQRGFRANLLTVIGGVLFAVAALLSLLALVRLLSRFRKPAEASTRLISDSTALRAAGRELAAVRRQREDGGWTPDLAGRALAALRIAGTYAVGRRASLMPAAAQSTAGSQPASNGQQEPEEAGRVIVRTGWPRGRRVAVSGAITSQSVGRDRIRRAGTAGFAGSELYESLEQALAALTAAQYGRNGKLDDGALDQALDTGSQVLKRARLDQTWVMKRLAARRVQRQGDTRAWSR
jgi:hypothetical protein